MFHARKKAARRRRSLIRFSSRRGRHPQDDGGRRFTVTPEWAAEKRQVMVEHQLRRRGIRDELVLEAMNQVPRHEFVSPEFAPQAYEDHPLPIGQGQTISQPYMVAAMVEALELKGSERVLEVGTGSGYQAAVLARLAARVYTIECNPVLACQAEERLRGMGLAESVVVICGDGSQGYPPTAPYDGILVAAAAPEVPDCYWEQLVEGGRLVIPAGSLDCQELRQIRKCAGQAMTRMLGYCRFVPLVGSQGWSTVKVADHLNALGHPVLPVHHRGARQPDAEPLLGHGMAVLHAGIADVAAFGFSPDAKAQQAHDQLQEPR